MDSLECNFRDHGRVRHEVTERSNLWFNQYEWAVSWHYPEITALRQGLDPAQVHKVLANRRYWEKNRYEMRQVGRVYPEFRSSITTDCERNILKIAAYLRGITAQYKMVLNSDHITIYTNDAEFVKDTAVVAENMTLGTVLVRQVAVTLPSGTIVLKRPYDYQYRTWFRSRKLEPQAIDNLQNWVESMGRDVYACPSLRKFLRGTLPRGWLYRSEWTMDHFFLDHNDPKLPVWIAMICPSIVKKTESIQSPAK